MLWKNFLTLKSLRRIRNSIQFNSIQFNSIQFNSLAKNSRGISIIEVLVSIGIMSIIGLGMATMIANQNKEVGALDEKMGLQVVQMQITNVLSSPAFCGCFIGANTFNYSAAPQAWNAFPNSISSSYDGACAATGGALLTVGTNMAAKMLPTAMNMQNITETTAGSGNFSANLVIGFDQTLLTRSRRSLSIPMYFTVNMADPVAARRLVSCSSNVSQPTYQ